MDKERLAVLLDVIGEEERYYRRLKEVSLRERQALLKGEIEDVEKGRERREEDMEVVRGLSEKRQELIDELGLGSAGRLLDREALDALEDGQAAELRSAGDRLRSAADELLRENRRNLKAARHTLDYLNFSLKAFEGEKEEATYGRDAKGKSQAREIGVTKLIDRQA